jgi:Clp amino terminal domain, pathogenicity island component
VVLERFNPAARTVVVNAQDVARQDRSHLIGTDHLLVALTVSLGTGAFRALALLGVSEAEVRKRVGSKGRWHRPSPPHIPFAPELTQVIKAGAASATGHGDLDIGSEHLLLWLVYYPQSAGGRILADLGVSPNSARDALAEVAGAGPSAEELRDAAQAAAGPDPIRRVDSEPDRQGVDAADATIRSVMRVDIPPDQAWPLLSSPHVWALSPRGCVMFDVPGPGPLWLLAGEFPGRDGLVPQCIVFETSMTPGRMELKLSGRLNLSGRLKLSGRLREPLDYALSVVPRGRGASDVSVSCTAPAMSSPSIGAQAANKRELDEWLRAICDVLVGRSPRPAGEIPPKLLRAWTSERRIEQPVTKSAAVLIDAEPDAVWNVVHGTWTAAIEGWPSLICSGHVPGTPVGAVGEMQYGVFRRADGSRGGSVSVVIQHEDRQMAVTQNISPWNARTSYRLSAEGGRSRLEMTCEWPGATMVANTEDAVTRLLESPRKILDAYKTHIESSTRGTEDPA